MAGLQCHKLLWWMAHEPAAAELDVDDARQAVFDQGHRVGALARTYVPGGALVDLPHNAYEQRLEATRQALAQGAPAVYEAAFRADGVFVSVDILERVEGGFRLIEVKSTAGVKDAAPGRRGGADARAAPERPRRRPHGGHAPQPRLRVSGPERSLHAGRRDRAGRGAAGRGAGRARGDDRHARGPAAERGHRPALLVALRVPVHRALLAGAAALPRQHAPRACSGACWSWTSRGTAASSICPRICRSGRSPIGSDGPCRRGASWRSPRSARPSARSPRRWPSSTSRPSPSPSRCGPAATPSTRCPCSSARTCRTRAGRCSPTPGSRRGPAIRARRWPSGCSPRARAPAPSRRTARASSATASGSSRRRCRTWPRGSRPSRRAWWTCCPWCAITFIIRTSAAASRSSACCPRWCPR